uniref:Uncharacterized protein n=1 Tax=Anguilla anguilla TaxID=7936 RepID=A0A0E9U691_ANGAN
MPNARLSNPEAVFLPSEDIGRKSDTRYIFVYCEFASLALTSLYT